MVFDILPRDTFNGFEEPPNLLTKLFCKAEIFDFEFSKNESLHSLFVVFQAKDKNFKIKYLSFE